MLRAMGIDVWFERPTAAGLEARLRTAAAAVAPLPTPVRRSATDQPGGPPARGHLPGVTTPSRDPAASSRSGLPLPAAAPANIPEAANTTVARGETLPTESFALLCLRGSSGLLVASAPVTRNRQRLARDILQAIAVQRGETGGKVQAIDFVYPPLQGGTSTPPDRVLRAFFSRQLEGLRAPEILICADAASRFAGWFLQPHRIIPGLGELLGDARRKRELWQTLQGVPAAGGSPEPGTGRSD